MAERRHYRLRISGVGIVLSSSQPLPVTERFAPFLTEDRGTDFFVEYREVPALTVPLGEPVYKGERFWVWQEENGGFIKTMWCGSLECELAMKDKAGMSSRCIPFHQEALGETCAICGKKAKHMLYWGVAY